MKLASLLRAATLLWMVSSPAAAVAPETSTQVVDLTKLSIKGLPPAMKVTVYRAPEASAKQPLVFMIPQFGSVIKDDWFASRAQYFTEAGYAVLASARKQ